MLNVRQTMSFDANPDGAMAKAQVQMPNTQLMEISTEDRRLNILMIKGMFHNGLATEAMSPTCSMICMRSLFYI
jgi:hypothetical protein